MRFHAELEANLAMMRDTFADAEEVQYRQVTFGEPRYTLRVLFVYCVGMIDLDRFSRDVMSVLYLHFLQFEYSNLSAKQLEETLPISILSTEQFLEPLIPQIFRGQLVIIFDGIDVAYVVDLSNPPKRQPEEPSTEASVRGPKDGFIEVLETNVALIRKRLPTETLSVKGFVIGVRTQTKVSLLYIRDIIDPSIVADVEKRLQEVRIDGLYASSQIEDFLSKPKSLVPLFAYSSRPDFMVGALLRGRFVIVVDGAPTAIVGPANLPLLMEVPEDAYASKLYLILQRGLRLLGFHVTLLLPGFYVAISTYHPDQIPLALLSTIATSRRGTPFPTPIEAFLMLIMFEMFREAGNLLPGKLGQTLAVVGGLVIGESAIDAGLTSPSLLMVTATSAIAAFTLGNQSLMGVLVMFRFFILAVSSFFGELGFLVASFVVLVYMTTKRSFGLPYFAPFSPFHARDAFNTVNTIEKRTRPTILRIKDRTRG